MSKVTPLVLFFLTISVCFFTLTGPKNLFLLMKLRGELSQLESTESKLQGEIAVLNDRIDLATYDQFFLEKKAREELALSKPGEIVYIFPKR